MDISFCILTFYEQNDLSDTLEIIIVALISSEQAITLHIEHALVD